MTTKAKATKKTTPKKYVVTDQGDKHYLNAGKLHRLDGPAVIRKDGTTEWWMNGHRHRVGEPAIEYPDGTKVWCLNGDRHREDGPAVLHSTGAFEWRYKGVPYDNVLDFCDAAGKSKEDAMILLLKWGR